MNKRFLPTFIFLLALGVVPLTHHVLLSNQPVDEPGEVAGVTSATVINGNMPNWCLVDRIQYSSTEKAKLNMDYNKTIAPYEKVKQEYPREAEVMDRLIDAEKQRYELRLSELESQNEASESDSCLAE